MERLSFSDMECPIAQAVNEVGDAWVLLILREAFKGARTFAEFSRELPIAPTTLTRRLETLTERGFFVRVEYQPGSRRECYAPTPKALELMPVLVALGAWGNRWLAPRGACLTPIDATTGKPLDIVIIDRHTKRPLAAGRVALKAGPGASRRLRGRLTTPIVLGGPSLSGAS